MNIDELAAELDCAVATIRKYLRNGMPRTGKGTKAEPFEFDPLVCAKWMKDKGLTGTRGRPQGALAEELQRAKLRQINAMAAIRELELDTARGKVIERDSVEAANVQKFTVIRNQLMGPPATVAPLIVGLDVPEIERQLDERIRETLEELSKEK